MDEDAGLSQEGECSTDSIYAQIGCDYISIRHLYGGLTPAHPIVLCNLDDPDFMRGGPVTLIDVVNINGELEVLRGRGRRVSELFAPIDTPEEALSYALLTTDRYAWFPSDPLWEGYTEFYVDEIEATHVVETDKGYRVFLFDGTEGGCGEIDVVESAPVDVARDGMITLLDKTKLLGFVGVCF